MNKHPNGTIIVGAPYSYQYMLSGLTDILKGKGDKTPKVFEIHHFHERIKEEGIKLGYTIEKIRNDLIIAHDDSRGNL